MGMSSVRAHSSTAFPGACAIEAGGEQLLMLPDRAVFHPASRSLLVADVHLGKAATFRALGVPVPSGTTERTLARLDTLLAGTGSHALYLLGDLLHGPHARRGSLFEALTRWRMRHRGVETVLVRGNHDGQAGDPPSACGIDVVDPGYRVGGLRLLHEPEAGDSVTAEQSRESSRECGQGDRVCSLAGHLHPVWRLGSRSDKVRLPCFWVRGDAMVLPAFGEFTGGWLVPAALRERIFVTDGEAVRAVPFPAPRIAPLYPPVDPRSP
jgi:DNA ligase-associated metallophosphoesterase